MDESFLLKEISRPISKKEATKLAEQSVNLVNELIMLCLNSNYEVAFRAAWILELFAGTSPEHFDEHLNDFFATYVILRNQSGQRHFTKILMRITNMHSKLDCIPITDLEAIVATTFEWMIDLQTPVAVRVNCMDILYNLKSKDDWIEDELRAQIDFQLRSGSAALQSRGKKLLHKLDRTSRKS